MNYRQKNRFIMLTIFIILLSGASVLMLYALKQNINLFFTPTEFLSAHITENQIIRIGGYVKKGSVHFDANGENISFVVTDRKNEITINYHGVLPNLFREGQVVIITGKNNSHLFIATQVLAKHDEKYMPRNLAKELENHHAA